jgi:hypothetical protein
MKIVFYLGLLLGSLFAQEINLPIELNAWKSLSYVGAAKSAAELSTATLEVGKASYVGLNNTPKVKYVVRPMNEGGSVSYGGIFQIDIKESGIYRVALGNASWIDVTKDGKVAQSIAHNEGPKNSGIRKMVDYNLESGTYVVQLSAGADSSSAILVTKIK